MKTGYGTTEMLNGTTHMLRPLLLLALLVLGGCASSQQETPKLEVLDEIQTTLETAAAGSTPVTPERPPEDVLQALVPGLTLNSAALQPVEERFDFTVQEPMDAREFFSLLTAGTDYSIALHPGVEGTISALDLKNVSIQEALDQVSALYGYQITRSGNIFQVAPNGLETRIFMVNYLNVNRSGSSTMSVSSGGLNGGGSGGSSGGNNNGDGSNNNGGNNNNNGGGNNNNGNNNGGNGNSGTGGGGSGSGGANISTSSEADYWADLTEIITAIIGTAESGDRGGEGLLGAFTSNASATGGRAVIVSPQTGMIMVRAYPSELSQVAEFLAAQQDALQRQVVLEAKILEVTLNEEFQAGIDLGVIDRMNSNDTFALRSNFLNEQQRLLDDGSPAPIPLAGIPQTLQLAYDSMDFDGVIRLLESQGTVQVISSPRITTLNNQKAVFKVGGEEYFSTDQSTTTTTGGNSTVQNSNVSLEPFFSGIALDVTPQISEAGDIILHIHPLLNSVERDIKTVAGTQLTLPRSDTRESDSIARARNGEVVIISGLMQTRARGAEAGIPGARDLPVVGNAFERTQRETEKTELVILLRAIVDDGNSMRDLIREHNDSFNGLRGRVDSIYR